MKTSLIACTVVLAAGAVAAALTQTQAQQKSTVAPAVVDRYVDGTFKGASDEWKARIKQDEAQRLCSEHRNNLPAALSTKLLEDQKKTVVFPADGNVIGDWKRGAAIAQSGRGGQFSDPPGTVGGGNCYACHQLSKAEVSYGTMGPSLDEYGKIRKYSAEAAKDAYAKIYNAQAVMPCSNMPRFGLTKALSEQQIKDAVAYLFSPDSPVNK
jgi:L-cysteine S-thiosulfotransferase